MKARFPGYFTPSEKDFKELWNQATFFYDANVLLDIYRFSEDTRREFFQILNKISSRSWLSHQAALEFLRNRPGVIQSMVNLHDECIKSVSDSIKKEVDRVLTVRNHPSINKKELLEKVQSALRPVIDDLKQQKKDYPDYLKTDSQLTDLLKIFEGRVTDEYSEDKLEEIYSAGKRRYENRVPPGYCDRKKNGNQIYGDLVMWFQIIGKSIELKTPIIFITTDEKEDWWWILNNQTLGPRPELIQEMWEKTKNSFYMYKSDQFMRYAKSFLKININQESIKEIQKLREINNTSPLASQLYRSILENNVASSKAIEEIISSWEPISNLRTQIYNKEPFKDLLSSISIKDKLITDLTTSYNESLNLIKNNWYLQPKYDYKSILYEGHSSGEQENKPRLEDVPKDDENDNDDDLQPLPVS